jgi:hypothetical protein
MQTPPIIANDKNQTCTRHRHYYDDRNATWGILHATPSSVLYLQGTQQGHMEY